MSVIEKIAIDLGTRSSFCYVNSQDKFVKEPSIVVVNKSIGYIAAAGNKAKKSYDKLSKEYIQIEPFKNGHGLPSNGLPSGGPPSGGSHTPTSLNLSGAQHHL